MSNVTTFSTNYWDNFQILEPDIEYLYNYLLEVEMPQTSQELVTALIKKRIADEVNRREKAMVGRGTAYLPKDAYTTGEKLVFPALEGASGTVKQVRDGFNPDITAFKVIEVEFGKDEVRSFASEMEDHILNQPASATATDPNMDPQNVLAQFKDMLVRKLESELQDNKGLVQIAGSWFPCSLLVDVNIGYLNLAEALLDEKIGGPLPTETILKSIELPTDTNLKLSEFSLNLALQEDERFDEVGPSGEVLWFLHRLEPSAVLNQPAPLKFGKLDYDFDSTKEFLNQLSANIVDELEPLPDRAQEENDNEVVLSLIYPHWRSGTLPLAINVAKLIPSAYKSPRVLFTFVDGNTEKKFGGWAVRSLGYVYGLSEWYAENDVIPGSLIHVAKGHNPGEVIITAEKKRTSKEYINTTLVGADGGVVFALLKQNVSTVIDERMAVCIPDPD